MDEMTWRPSRLARVISCTVGIMLVVFAFAVAVVAVVEPSSIAVSLFLIAILGPSAAVFFRYAFGVSIAADSQGLIVRSLLRTTTRVPWVDVTDCSAGYYGITIHLRDGSFVRASASQKPNHAKWFDRETRADRIAAEIRHRAALAGT
jgi:Bacterial PH domain